MNMNMNMSMMENLPKIFREEKEERGESKKSGG